MAIYVNQKLFKSLYDKVQLGIFGTSGPHE